MNKLLSVIVPTYNMEKYLHKCLNSLIINEEDMRKMEILVINDGSKDGSSIIAHEYEEKYPETFRVIDKKNGNYGSCINKGIEEAKGKYVKVLDADDYFRKESLVRYLKALNTTDADMLATDFSIVDEDYNIVRTQTFKLDSGCVSKIEDVCLTKDFCGPLGMHATTYKLQILKEMGYHQTEGVSYTDQEWMFTPTAYMDTFQYIPIDLYQYLVGREGQTVSPELIHKQGNVRIMLLLKRIDFYNEILANDSISEQKKDSLKEKLMINIINTYYIGIVGGFYEYGLLVKFDTQLKEKNIDLYDLSAIDKRVYTYGLNYVQAWRGKSFALKLINVMRCLKRYLNKR